MKPWAICAGNRRTGSTVHYHYVREVVERLNLGKGLGAVPGGAIAADRSWTPQRHKSINGIKILRTHGPTEAINPIIHAVGSRYLFYIQRDIRDMIVSLMNLEKRNLSYCLGTWFRDRVKIHRFWTSQSEMLLTKYEDIISNPQAEILRIQKFLNLPEDVELAKEIAYEYSLKNVQKKIDAGQSENPYGAVGDGQKQDFLNTHIFSGKVGQWKDRFSEAEIKQIHKVVEFFVKEQGYEL